MYRHTIKTLEYLPDGSHLEFFTQERWTSVFGRIPGPDKELVLIEEKEIEVAESCIRRKKNGRSSKVLSGESPVRD